MVDDPEHRCRYCGSLIQIPQLFSNARQQVFEFVWKTPGCTIKDIMIGVYGRVLETNVVGVHLSHIKRTVRSIDYCLKTAYLYPPVSGRLGRRRTKRYWIKPKSEKAISRPNEGIQDGAV
jgi:hypothetical protein